MAISEQKVPLWRQLQATATVLQAIRSGVSGTAALDSVTGDLRPGVQALTFHVLRSLGRAEALRQRLAKRSPPPPADALLCTALALAWCEADAPYEVFTLVNQAVEAAKRDAATRSQASFINACLRRFLRERDALVASTDNNPVAVWNHPKWWIERLKRDWPQDWQVILKANNCQPPLTLRVNRRQSSVPDYVLALQHADIQGCAAGPSGVVLHHAKPVQMLPGFAAGVVSVQDFAAQMAAPLLLSGLAPVHPEPLRVLDACAAPGGKTAHLLEWADAEVTALEVDVTRAQRIHQTLQRLALTAKVLVADAVAVTTWWDGQLFDAVLLDAPCSASGIVRRHPDVRWLRRDTDIDQLVKIQAEMLKALWPLVRSGGRLLYCTCSVFKAEGSEQLQTFLAHHTDAVLMTSPGHLMPRSGVGGNTLPDNSDHDGFYYALLQKRPA